MSAANINQFVAELIIDHLARLGVDCICLSPGSRSTPLTVAAASRPDVSVKMNTDERGAGYCAVGYARASGRIPAAVCTSGTAAANLFPAVVEAYQSRLPMVLLTADRPEELQNCGANQTIDQENIFGRYVLAKVTVGAFDRAFDPERLLDVIDEALRTLPDGPVHINCRFREPLAPSQESFDSKVLIDRVKAWYREWETTGTKSVSKIASTSDLDEITRFAGDCDKGLIIAGPEALYRKCRKLSELAEILKWPVLADIHSQHRFDGGKDLIAARYDLYLDIEDIANNLRPGMIIHIGGLPTSKRLNQFLLDHRGIDYIKIQNHDRTIDPDRLETRRIVGDPDDVIERLCSRLPVREESSYTRRWMDLENECGRILSKHFDDGRLTEPSLAGSIGRFLPNGHALYLSNSMPIRDADSFISAAFRDIIVGANRGASGIDGVIASACGFAAGCGRPTTLLIGDLACIHDLNSLALVKNSDVPVIVVVINNRGGGIFHFLPIVEFDPVFEPYFGAPHDLTFESAAKMFDLPYHHPADRGDFESCYKDVCDKGRSAIIEITTDRRENAAEHETIRSQLRQRLSEMEIKK